MEIKKFLIDKIEVEVEVKKIWNIKVSLKESKVFMNNDLTPKERTVQSKINEKFKVENSKIKKIK